MEETWQKAETGWDIGFASSVFEKYFSVADYQKNPSILILGCGNAHEADMLI